MRQQQAKKSLRDVNQPLFRYWEALYLSFYSQKLYSDVRQRWKGFGFKYLMLAVFAFSLPLGVKVTYIMLDFFDTRIIQPLVKLPDLMIQNGTVSTEEPTPYFVKDKKGRVLAVVDTGNKINTFSQKYPDMTILVKKDAIYTRYLLPSNLIGIGEQTNSTPQIAKQEFKHSENIILNMQDIINYSGVLKIKLAIQFLIMPLIIGITFSIYFIILFCFAFLGQVIALSIFRFNIKYKESSRLLALAMTPSLAFSLLSLTFGLYFKFSGLISLIILLAYYCFGLIGAKKDMNKLVHQ